MKKLLLIILILISANVYSQIAGISNDKLVVVNQATIGTQTFEFEPGFGYLWSTKTFDQDGKLVSLKPQGDSTLVLQALGFRFTYGFAKNFEIGSLITSNLNTFSLGIKYTFLDKEKAVSGRIFRYHFFQ